jgi:hypothetical protein
LFKISHDIYPKFLVTELRRIQEIYVRLGYSEKYISRKKDIHYSKKRYRVIAMKKERNVSIVRSYNYIPDGYQFSSLVEGFVFSKKKIFCCFKRLKGKKYGDQWVSKQRPFTGNWTLKKIATEMQWWTFLYFVWRKENLLQYEK